MPRKDGKGPRGIGAMTGRGYGDCQGGTRGRFSKKKLGIRKCFNGTKCLRDRDSLVEEKELLEKRIKFIQEQLDN